MSDGSSEIARDQERGMKHETYMIRLFDYLENATTSNYDSLRLAAHEVDSVRGGYWCPGSTKLEGKLDETLKKLGEKNEKVWNFYIGHAKNVSFENIKEMIEKLSMLEDKYPEFITSYLNIFNN